MAGYSKIYCIGGLGGFQGADGINPILLQLWVGDGDRQWLEARYFDSRVHPLGALKVLIPEGPNHPHALIDACIAFYPLHFEACPALPIVAERLETVSRLDFDCGKADIPKEWHQLRTEALPLFRKLNVFEADLRQVNNSKE